MDMTSACRVDAASRSSPASKERSQVPGRGVKADPALASWPSTIAHRHKIVSTRAQVAPKRGSTASLPLKFRGIRAWPEAEDLQAAVDGLAADGYGVMG